MMKLLSMEIEGFKSFAKFTEIDVSKNVVVIVGPNGSGKSNIVDAIRWLLGEQSSKQIRISDKTDVIFGGTDQLKSATKAKVFLKILSNDNKIHKIGRIVDISGTSTYYLNDKPVYLKQMQTVFDNKGVGKQFYSIISQGQVSEIVNSSSETLKKLVLDVVDIGEFLEKKQSSIFLLEKSTENLERLSDVLYEMDKRIKSLSNKASRAKHYMDYREELVNISKKYFGAERLFIQEKISLYKYMIDENTLKMNEVLKELFDTERSYRALKSEFDDVDKELNQQSELLENYNMRTKTIEQERDRIKEKINECNTQIVSKDWALKSNEENSMQKNKRLEEVTTLEKSVFNELSEIEKIISEIKNEKEKLIEEINEEEKEINFIVNSKKELESAELKLASELKNIDKELSDKTERIKYLELEEKNLSEHMASLKAELEKIQNEFKQVSSEEEKIRGKITDKTESINSKIREKEKHTKDIEQLSKEKNNLKYKLESLNNQIHDYEGYSGVVKDFFKIFKDDSNVIDVVANLIEVPEEYEEAVSASAGGRLQNIVIKSSDQAKFYINEIKKQSSGKLTFLPMDILNPRLSLKKVFLQEPGALGFLIDLVNFDNNFRKVMEYVFSNTLLVDRLESAIKISKIDYNGTIVTLDGEIISGYGAITGGKTKSDYSATILKRKREIQEIHIKLEEIEENLKYRNQMISEIEAQLMKEKNILNELNSELNDLLVNKNIKNSTYKSLYEEYKSKEKNHNEISERIIDYTNSITKLSFRKEEIVAENSKNALIIEELTEKLNKKNELSSTKSEELKELDTKMREKNYERQHVQKRYDEYHTERIELNRECNRLSEEKETLQNDYKELDLSMKKYEQELSQSIKEFESLNNEINKIFEMLRTGRSDRHEKTQKLENFESKINEIKERKEKLKEEKQKFEFEIKNYEYKIEFQNEKAKNLNISSEEFILESLNESEIQALHNKMEDLEKNLNNLGSVDLSVIQEYDDVKEDFETRNHEKEDILESINTMKAKIHELDELAEHKFNDFFNALNERFKYYISKLFINGYGELRLIGEGKSFEKGIEISVKKAGRPFQKLSLFSGGEKALIAIAFLFSMMDLNPSPFYILDEIDAPLDDVNTSKIANLINENSNKSQFLIITHNKLLMEIAEIFHGITMKNGITRVIPVNFHALEETV